MDLFVFLSSFLYRIRFKLITGVTIAVVLAYILSDYLPKNYSVTTTIFTGISSKSSVDDLSGRIDWNTANNAHENIINLIKSKSTLESISIKLIAQHLMYGGMENCKFITPEHYQDLLRIIGPHPHILELVDKNSFENTVKNLTEYRTESQGNTVYALFNWDNKYYGYLALSQMKIMRKGASDMIEITYMCDDPGIASSTLVFLNEELKLRYEDLLLSASNDVVKYFKEQLALTKHKLDSSEIVLEAFNVENKIINYEEQTKHLAALNNSFEGRYEEVLLMVQSSQALIDKLASQMDTRTKLVVQNQVFLNALNDVSTLNGKIAELEIFDSEQKDTAKLSQYKRALAQTEARIQKITDKMEGYKFSKEGVAIPDMVSQWLTAMMNNEKSKAELLVLEKRRKEIDNEYTRFSPVGPNLGKQLRNVRVEEESYLTTLHNLQLAIMRQKNIKLDAGTLQIVTPPDYPLLTMPRKRHLYMLAALFGSFLFIVGFYLLIEMLDRTIRDGDRAARLTKGKVVAAIPSDKAMQFRRYAAEARQSATAYLANILNTHIEPTKPLIVNLLSVEQGEGKSYIADNLEQYWEDHGMKVSYLSYEGDLDCESKQFMQATSIYNIHKISSKIENADVIIVEYASLNQNNAPKALLNEASVNLVVLNAQRAWYPSDNAVFGNLKAKVDNGTIYICLNNANRDSVEQYTGQLPPYSAIRKLSYRLMHFGITAKS